MHNSSAGIAPEEVRGGADDRPVVLRPLNGETQMNQTNSGATRPWYYNVKIALGLLATIGTIAYYGVTKLEQWHANKVTATVAQNIVVGTDQLAKVDKANAEAVNLADQARAANVPEAVIELAHSKLAAEISRDYAAARDNMAPLIAAATAGEKVPVPLQDIVKQRTTLEVEAEQLLQKFKAGELATAAYNPPAEQTANSRASSYYTRPTRNSTVNTAAAAPATVAQRTIVSPNPAPAREVSPQISNANSTVLVSHNESVANDNPNASDGFRFRVGSK